MATTFLTEVLNIFSAVNITEEVNIVKAIIKEKAAKGDKYTHISCSIYKNNKLVENWLVNEGFIVKYNNDQKDGDFITVIWKSEE